MRSRLAALSLTSHEVAGGEQAERAANGGQWGAQLVADGGDELVLQPVEGIPLADVAEAEDGAGKAAMIEDGGEDVLGGEGDAVAAEDGIFAGGGLLIPSGAEEGAIGAALAAGRGRAVEQVMNGLAVEGRSVDAQDARGGGIGKGDEAEAIDAADGIGNGVEQNLLLAVKVFGADLFLGGGHPRAERGGGGGPDWRCGRIADEEAKGEEDGGGRGGPKQQCIEAGTGGQARHDGRGGEKHR